MDQQIIYHVRNSVMEKIEQNKRDLEVRMVVILYKVVFLYILYIAFLEEVVFEQRIEVKRRRRGL